MLAHALAAGYVVDRWLAGHLGRTRGSARKGGDSIITARHRDLGASVRAPVIVECLELLFNGIITSCPSQTLLPLSSCPQRYQPTLQDLRKLLMVVGAHQRQFEESKRRLPEEISTGKVLLGRYRDLCRKVDVDWELLADSTRPERVAQYLTEGGINPVSIKRENASSRSSSRQSITPASTATAPLGQPSPLRKVVTAVPSQQPPTSSALGPLITPLAATGPLSASPASHRPSASSVPPPTPSTNHIPAASVAHSIFAPASVSSTLQSPVPVPLRMQEPAVSEDFDIWDADLDEFETKTSKQASTTSAPPTPAPATPANPKQVMEIPSHTFSTQSYENASLIPQATITSTPILTASLPAPVQSSVQEPSLRTTTDIVDSVLATPADPTQGVRSAPSLPSASTSQKVNRGMRVQIIATDGATTIPAPAEAHRTPGTPPSATKPSDVFFEDDSSSTPAETIGTAEKAAHINKEADQDAPITMDVDTSNSPVDGMDVDQGGPPSSTITPNSNNLPYILPAGPFRAQEPFKSMRDLVKEAISASPDHRLFVQHICQYISTVHPFYSASDPSFRKAVSRALSKYFTKFPREKGPSLWGLKDETQTNSALSLMEDVREASCALAGFTEASDSKETPGSPYTLPPGPYLDAEPAAPMVTLVQEAIHASHEGSLPARDIASYIRTVYPFYSARPRLETLVGSVLGGNMSTFVKVLYASSGPSHTPSHAWAIAAGQEAAVSIPRISRPTKKDVCQLITQAISSTPQHKMLACDILAHILRVHPCFRKESEQLRLKKQISRILSRKIKVFRKVLSSDGGPSLWALRASSSRAGMQQSLKPSPLSPTKLTIRIPSRLASQRNDVSTPPSSPKDQTDETPVQSRDLFGEDWNSDLSELSDSSDRESELSPRQDGGVQAEDSRPSSPESFASKFLASEKGAGVTGPNGMAGVADFAMATDTNKLVASPESGTEARKASPFGLEAQLVSSQRGFPVATEFKLPVYLDIDQWPKVEAWNTASSNCGNASRCLCVSLVCYRVDDVCGQLDASLPDRWWIHTKPVSPRDFGLRPLTVTLHGKHITLPFTFTPVDVDYLDITPWLLPGANYLTFTQGADLSQYVFAVIAHYPNPEQLRSLARLRAHRQVLPEWTAHIPVKRPDFEAMLKASRDVTGVDLVMNFPENFSVIPIPHSAA
ncbi:hypothetical protein K488DRAFT_89956 [Vararia minispora EC-137]|uniref:Uncharacterized protein n=1 Tax=Vararia minispora EC-137 TaxID=1314806 RepID=A0ACB8Q9G3_9AGAM|nr:hypothetical protein K488DRAFT_89956 [Vararia minispora EC-137]